jgi:hypothetical protein
METKEIIEGNQLIAEFVGYVEVDGIKFDLPHNENHAEEYEYHSSWDWIMPVVERVESIGYWIRMDYNDVFVVVDDTNIVIENPMRKDTDTKLLLVWRVVVEFVKWYNKNKP